MLWARESGDWNPTGGGQDTTEIGEVKPANPSCRRAFGTPFRRVRESHESHQMPELQGNPCPVFSLIKHPMWINLASLSRALMQTGLAAARETAPTNYNKLKTSSWKIL